MGCRCGEKATTTTVYVVRAKDGTMTEHATRADAEYARNAAGGGTVSTARK